MVHALVTRTARFTAALVSATLLTASATGLPLPGQSAPSVAPTAASR